LVGDPRYRVYYVGRYTGFPGDLETEVFSRISGQCPGFSYAYQSDRLLKYQIILIVTKKKKYIFHEITRTRLQQVFPIKGFVASRLES